MSAWEHAICDSCWTERNPGREPVRVHFGDMERCCYCGELTLSGIYVRGDPAATPCGGAQGRHAQPATDP